MKIAKLFFAFILLSFLTQPNWVRAQTDSSLWSIDLPEVITTAQPRPTDIKSALHQIRTISREVLQSRGVTNLEQALQQVAGIRLTQDLIIGSGLTLMGLGGQNIQIMIDGVPVIGRRDGQIDLGQINMLDVVRIEIVEGPLAVSYGTNALAGVINIVTRGSQITPLEMMVGAQYESLAESRLEAGLGWQLNKEWLVKANGAFDRFTGWKADESSRAYLWNPKDQYVGKVSMIYQPRSNSRVRLEGHHFHEEVTLFGTERRPQFKPYAFDQIFSTRRGDWVASYEGDIGQNAYLKATTAYNRFSRIKDAYRINFEEKEQVLMTDDLDTSQFSSWMLRAQVAWPQSESKWSWQIGVDLRADQGRGQRIAGENGELGTTQRLTDLAAFAKIDFRAWEPLTLQMGLRYGYNSAFEMPVIPSFHLKYELTEHWQFRSSYGKGFRSPDLKELYFEFIDINHFILGNPALTPESADHLQASMVYNQQKGLAHWSFNAMVFFNALRNRISLYEFVDTPNGPIIARDTSTLRFAYFNQDRFFTQGARLGADWRNDHWSLGLQTQATGLFNELHETDASVNRFTYQWNANASVRYRFGESIPVQVQAFAHWQNRLITYYPERNEQGQTVSRQRIQDGFTQIDCTASISFWDQRLQLTAGVRNILNVQQVNVQGGSVGAHTGGGNSAPVNPGRSQFVSIRFIPTGK